jgi:hypothetical protein
LRQTYTFLFFFHRIHSPSDVLGKSLADLQKQFSEILARSQWEKEEAQVRERKLHEEMALQQEKLANGQEEFRQACERALEARVRKGRDCAEGGLQQMFTACKLAHPLLFSLTIRFSAVLKSNAEYGY